MLTFAAFADAKLHGVGEVDGIVAVQPVLHDLKGSGNRLCNTIGRVLPREEAAIVLVMLQRKCDK